MKITVILIFLSISNINAQKNLLGFSDFKINKSTVEIVKNNKYGTFNLLEADSTLEGIDAFGIRSNPGEEISYCSFCNLSKTYFSSQIELGGVILKSVFVTFLKDTLIEIRSDEVIIDQTALFPTIQNTRAFLDSKFGKGIITSYLYFKKSGGVETWTNNNIIMKCGEVTYFDYTTGKKKFPPEFFSLVIRDQSKINKVIECSESLRKKYLFAKTKALKDKTSKF